MSESHQEEQDLRAAGVGQISPLGFAAQMTLAMERPRIAAGNRVAHLGKHGKTDPFTEELFRRVRALENWVDKETVKLLETHPAAPWFLRIKNLRGEAWAKVIAEIESFSRYYEVGDPMIPTYDGDLTVPERYRTRQISVFPDKDGNEKSYVWVTAIERFTTCSQLRKYAGLYPGAVAKQGEKLPFNSTLRTMLWRVAENLIRADGKFKGFYDQYRAYKEAQFRKNGIKVIPTPRGRLCPECKEEKKVPSTTFLCPDCGTKMLRKMEPEGVIFIGHLHNMCRRRMIQMLLDLFWDVYRRAEGLPTRQPYPIEFLEDHTHAFMPEMMVDKD